MEEGSESRMQKRERTLDPSLPNHDRNDEEEEGEEQRPKKMRSPAMFSEIWEAPAFIHLLETTLRRHVKEAVDAAFSTYFGCATGSRGCSTEQRDGPHQRNLQLQFQSELSTCLYTQVNIKAIKVVLLDASTRSVKTSGPESSVKLQAVVLEGDFNSEDEDDWTKEEFESNVVKEREGKRPLLLGNCQVITLKEGRGTLENLCFTDNSSWVRSRKFKIGLKVVPGFCVGIRIREAETNAFTVRDHRGESYKKHHPPALDDDVWRLEKISKDGIFHNRLNDAGIYFVKDFLRHLAKDPKKLSQILGCRGLPNKTWVTIENHANTCLSNGKQYVYYPDDSREVGVVFNDAYKLKHLITGGHNCPADSLSDDKKVYADNLVKKACGDWDRTREYDGILNHKQNIAGTQRTPYDTFDQRLPPTCLPTPIIRERPTIGGLLPGGISSNGNPTTEHLIPSQNLNSNFHLQFGGSSSSFQSTSHQTKISRNDSMLGPASGPSHSSISGLNNGFPSNLPAKADSDFLDWSSIHGEENLLMMELVDHNGYDMLQGHFDANVGVPDNFHLTQKGCSLSSELSSQQKCSQNERQMCLSGVSSQQNCNQDDVQMHLSSGVSSQQNCIQGEGQGDSSKKAFPKWCELNAVIMFVIRIRNKLAKKAQERLVHVLPLR